MSDDLLPYSRESMLHALNVRFLLEGLPGDPGEIAKYLQSQGIKGACGDGNACPLTQWLRQRVHNDSLHVTGLHAAGLDGDGFIDKIYAILPDGAKEFVERFDNEEYPELILEAE